MEVARTVKWGLAPFLALPPPLHCGDVLLPPSGMLREAILLEQFYTMHSKMSINWNEALKRQVNSMTDLHINLKPNRYNAYVRLVVTSYSLR